MKNKITAIIINLILFLSTIYIACTRVVIGAGSGQVGSDMVGIGYFKAFTNLSNIFNGLTALFALIYLLKNYKAKELINKSIFKLQYVSCVAVFLTFVTVVLFLTPTLSHNGEIAIWLYLEDMFHFHVFNPLLSIFLICFVYKNNKITTKDNLFALIPTILYSIVYLIMVVTGRWSDFYGFTFGGKFELIPLVLIVMYGVTYLLGYIVKRIRNCIN